jgi:hypothetical protein
MHRVILLLISTALIMSAQSYTRGVGVYPGEPKDDTSPVLTPDSTYRNLALHRPAWHSSSHDYNHTAQLVTDGIKHSVMPRYLVVSTSQQERLKRNEREWLFDQNWVTTVEVKGRRPWIQFEIAGGEQPPSFDRLAIDASAKTANPENNQWSITLLGSNDAKSWTELGVAAGMARNSGEVKAAIALAKPAAYRIYKLQFENGRNVTWQVGELAFSRGKELVRIGGPFVFTSAWLPSFEDAGQQWVRVDLGTKASIDRVALSWIRPPASAELQVSDDAKSWKALQALTAEAKLATPVEARHVRIAFPADTTNPPILSELEVFGRGGLVPKAKPAASPSSDGRLDLVSGNWRTQRDSLVTLAGAALSRPGVDTSAWIPATVPGTVLASYLNAGALPDPNFGDNQLMISDSFFHADFWYRNEFVAPASAAGKRQWLNFDGVNWKADIFLNGSKLGRIEGGFIRGRFDVTGKLLPGKANVLAVKIEKNATPGSAKEKTYENPDKNGGALGADNPTYHASIGWDWIPTIRGRNTGIWNDVYLTATGPVTLENPFVTSKLPLPDTNRADVSVEVTVKNHEARAVSGTLRGKFGDASFEQPVSLPASGAKTIKLDPASTPALRLTNPKLWWPNGYGAQHLYDVSLRFEIAPDQVSDVKTLKTGVRQFAYSEDGGALRIWVNGRRFVPRGGNWGFVESMLRYRAREYDAALRYHAHMNFNMIRNWVGQIGDDELYEACDRHGIVIMQDFWLANPWDGPDPDNDALFMSNADDMILRIRNHPSVGLYCGRNEGYPLPPLDASIRKSLKSMHPEIHYISSSADDVVSGHGPYRAQTLLNYFTQRATPKFHSEMGMPNILTMDSLRDTMPESDLWPQNRVWGLHDFCLGGAQGGTSFNERIEASYGGAKSVEEWISLAQFVNYEGHRAMFEPQAKNRMGLLIWMSHPTWPSFVWQTYDYFLEPTAAYFGAKKASEPLHIQWNPASDSIEVVNYNAGDMSGLTASVEILNLDGSRQWGREAALDSKEDSVASVIKLEYPATLSATHFIRCKLTRGGDVVSENFYWRGVQDSNFKALRTLPNVTLEVATTVDRAGDNWVLRTKVGNPTKHPALMVRLKPVRSESGDRILPAIFSDNYIFLMPGESRTITTELRDADTRGETPVMVVEGFNVRSAR